MIQTITVLLTSAISYGIAQNMGAHLSMDGTHWTLLMLLAHVSIKLSK